MSVEQETFGVLPDGTKISRYIIRSGQLTASVLTYGAVLWSLQVPDRKGKLRDVVLGYRSLEGYRDNPACMGAVIAPNANRTAGARYRIGGKEYRMTRNEGANNLHSDLEHGAHKRVWLVRQQSDNSVTLELTMPDGDLGFPGDRTMLVTYEADGAGGLRLTYQMRSDAPTVFNPTNHSYFNLNGAGSVLDHQLMLSASTYTPVGEGSIPTGEILPVAGTPMDFRQFKTIGQDLHAPFAQFSITSGYDHNYAIDQADGTLRPFAVLRSRGSGIEMTGYTTQPGVQVYSGNYLGSDQGKFGAVYHAHDGIALETQFFPNALNEARFQTPLIAAGQWATCTTVYRFGVAS